jgi:SAM-dependent methyltransferase
MEEIKRRIQTWWDNWLCGSRAADAPIGSRRFFEQVDFYKDTYEPFTNKIAAYPEWKNKRVLEIGVGLGKDFSRFCAHGALACGVDLSEKSLRLTKQRLGVFGLKGNLCLADAENLPFKDGIFDLVFSWGVLHHTPGTQKAIDGIYSCLKPGGGKAVVMLYNKFSIFFLRIIKNYLLGRLWRPSSNKACFNRLLSISTGDGAGNPFSNVYSRREARRMFRKFENIHICAYQGGKGECWKMLRRFRILEKYLGWFLVIQAERRL